MAIHYFARDFRDTDGAKRRFRYMTPFSDSDFEFDGAGSYENSQNVRILKLAAALIATLNGHERTLIEGLSEETIAALEAVLY